MYTIIKKFNGKFNCQGRLKDGTEFWDEDNLDEAIKSMIQFAKQLNHKKIGKKDIKLLQEVIVDCVGLENLEE